MSNVFSEWFRFVWRFPSSACQLNEAAKKCMYLTDVCVCLTVLCKYNKMIRRDLHKSTSRTWKCILFRRQKKENGKHFSRERPNKSKTIGLSQYLTNIHFTTTCHQQARENDYQNKHYKHEQTGVTNANSQLIPYTGLKQKFDFCLK